MPEKTDIVRTRYRVLAVDADPVVLFLWRNVLLRPAGVYEVVTAGDGCDALEEFTRVPFDLVVTDIAMPDMDGVELTKAIRQLGHEIPIIWFTALGVPNMAEEAERLDVYCCLCKPLEVDEMRQAVADALEDPHKEKVP